MQVSTTGFDTFLSGFLSRDVTSEQFTKEVGKCSVSQVIQDYIDIQSSQDVQCAHRLAA